jgi:carboxylesterase
VVRDADPAEPFDLVGDGRLGVVCIHGLTGTPYEMRFLGRELGGAGFHVTGLRLPGHGTNLEDLDRTAWTDWANAVEDAFDTLQMLCERVAVVGQSLGGLLALHLASRRREVAAVVTLAAPLWLEGIGGRVARWTADGKLQRFFPRVRAVPKLFGRSDVRDKQTRAENPCYDKVPLRTLTELATFMRIVDQSLDRIDQPLLVLHGQHDHTAPVACAYRLAQRAKAERMRIFPRSYHLLAADVERELVATEVIDFLRRTLASGERSMSESNKSDDGEDHACVT